MSNVTLRPEDYRPSAPPQHDFGIGLIGCGNIARNAHLRAYATFGYRVVAACDIDQANLDAAAAQAGIPLATTELDELLACDQVELIDLAVHGNQRLPIVERIAASPPPTLKGILSQKPLAMSYADAERMVGLCEQAGIVFQVNQQARWAPAHRAAKQLLAGGVVGHLYCITHFQRGNQDRPNHWFSRLENANIVDHGVHYLDLIRHFAGQEPVRVKATNTMVPGQHAVTPMCHTINLEFAPEAGLMAFSHFNNIVPSPQYHDYTWYLDGTEATVLMNHQEVVLCRRETPHERHVWRIQGSWFPEAFGGSMGELMLAVAEGREPLTAGRDNLKSLRLAYGAVESAKTGEAVELA